MITHYLVGEEELQTADPKNILEPAPTLESKSEKEDPHFDYEEFKRQLYENDHYTNQSTDFVVNGVNMYYWYREAFLAPLLEKTLATLELHTTNRFKGLVLKQDGMPFNIGVQEAPCSVSISEPLVKGTSRAARDSLYDSLSQIFKEIFVWNKQNSDHIKTHSILCPFNLSDVHWTLLEVTLQVLEADGVYYPAPKIELKMYDSKSMLGKNNEDMQKQLSLILTRLVPEALRKDFEFVVSMPKVKQQPVKDTSACGALVIEMMRNVLESKKFTLDNTDSNVHYFTHSEILAIRSNHLTMLGDGKYNEMQLPVKPKTLERSKEELNKDVNIAEQKQNVWDDFPLKKAIYDLVATFSESDIVAFYLLIEEIVMVEKISFAYLSQDNYEPNPLQVNYFLSAYEAECNEYIKNLSIEFEDINNARFHLSIACAQKKCAEKIQAWFAQHQSILEPFLSEIFVADQLVTYKDNGLDKLMEVWKDLLACRDKNVAPSKPLPVQKTITYQYQRTALNEMTDDYDEYVMCDKKLPFELGFVGKKIAGKPDLGQISCQLGPELQPNNILYYTGAIKDGATNGSGTLYVYNVRHDNIFIYVHGTFWQGGFTAQNSEATPHQLDILRRHIAMHAKDFRLPVAVNVEHNRPRVIQYAKCVEIPRSVASNLPIVDVCMRKTEELNLAAETKPSVVDLAEDKKKIIEQIPQTEDLSTNESPSYSNAMQQLLL